MIIQKKLFTRLAAFIGILALSACAQLGLDEPVILDSDLAFEFGSAELTPAGARQIDMYVPSLAYRHPTRLEVVGHTDRIGSDDYNNRLSLQRAETVAQRLLMSGKFREDIVRIRGMGSRDPVVQCPDSDRQTLIDCLAPNRRVEIRVTETIRR